RVGAFCGSNLAKKNKNGKRMWKLYNVRSELAHGRHRLNIDNFSQARSNLHKLYLTENLLRKCWKKILGNPEIRNQFQGNSRSLYLNRISCRVSANDVGRP
ncbi:MAG: hypothetical protein VCF07_16165, partial [Nitrospinota bacterium]